MINEDFFKEMNDELVEIWNNDYYRYHTESSEVFDDWKKKVVPKLSGSYKNKLKRLEWNEESYLLSQNILRDMYFKYMKKKI